jgi:hypothetical protein
VRWQPVLPEGSLGVSSSAQLWQGLDITNQLQFTWPRRRLPPTATGLAEGHIGMIGVGRGYGLVFGYAAKLSALRPSSGTSGLGIRAEKGRHY